ncbi:MAG: alanine/glycine:cation symporter family protein [Priestia megaterium]
MDWFGNILGEVNTLLYSYVLIVLLVGTGIFLTFKTKFIQFRLIKEMFKLITEAAPTDKSGKKGISSFQAFTISAASRIGTGNIAGVATAIALGGPGAIFWMWMIALIGAASALIESTLAQVYKVKDNSTGLFRGGPAYYMEKGLNKRWMGGLFAVLITLSFGLVFNAVQSNTITLAFENSFGTSRLLVGIIMTVIFAVIIFGGIKRIAKISEYIVVVLAVLYIGMALFIIFKNIDQMPAVLSLIVKNAFGFEQALGGSIGATLINGVKRGLFSNEAGMGSAPNAAATAVTSHPVKQGLIQAFGVLTDTLVICTSTAFIVLLSPAYKQGLSGIELTQASLSTHIGSWASGFLAIMVFLFAFSTLIGNYYYGETNIEFLNSNKLWLWSYRVGVLAMVIFGSIAQLQLVWNLADLFMGMMVVVNLIAIFLLSKVAFSALHDYTQQKKEGKNPVFYRDALENNQNIECWERESTSLPSEKENII